MDDTSLTSPFKNRHLFHASVAALAGLRVLVHEKSAWRELAVLLLAIVTFAVVRDVYAFLLILIALMMLSVEALNTAIEVLADEVNEAFRPRIKAAKDLGAAAVVILVIAYGVTFCVVLAKQFLPSFATSLN